MILFSLYVNSITSHITTSFAVYADDIAIWATESPPQDLIDL